MRGLQRVEACVYLNPQRHQALCRVVRICARFSCADTYCYPTVTRTTDPRATGSAVLFYGLNCLKINWIIAHRMQNARTPLLRADGMVWGSNYTKPTTQDRCCGDCSGLQTSTSRVVTSLTVKTHNSFGCQTFRIEKALRD